MKKRRIRFRWTCSDYVHHEHRWYWTVWLCGKGQQFIALAAGIFGFFWRRDMKCSNCVLTGGER